MLPPRGKDFVVVDVVVVVVFVIVVVGVVFINLARDVGLVHGFSCCLKKKT